MWQRFSALGRGAKEIKPQLPILVPFTLNLYKLCTQQGHIQCLLTADYLFASTKLSHCDGYLYIVDGTVTLVWLCRDVITTLICPWYV